MNLRIRETYGVTMSEQKLEAVEVPGRHVDPAEPGTLTVLEREDPPAAASDARV